MRLSTLCLEKSSLLYEAFFPQYDKKGQFDYRTPPKSTHSKYARVLAIMTKDGKVYYSTGANTHPDVADDNGIPYDNIDDGGYIENGRYYGGNSDTFSGGYVGGIGDDDLLEPSSNITPQQRQAMIRRANGLL